MCVQSFFTWSRAGLRPAAASAPGRACGLAAGHVPAHAAHHQHLQQPTVHTHVQTPHTDRGPHSAIAQNAALRRWRAPSRYSPGHAAPASPRQETWQGGRCPPYTGRRPPVPGGSCGPGRVKTWHLGGGGVPVVDRVNPPGGRVRGWVRLRSTAPRWRCPPGAGLVTRKPTATSAGRQSEEHGVGRRGGRRSRAGRLRGLGRRVGSRSATPSRGRWVAGTPRSPGT